MFSATVYLRGALTLEALRREIGDPAFFSLLKTWAVRFEDSAATTDDFLMLVEQTNGADARRLVEAWIFDDVMPDLAPAA